MTHMTPIKKNFKNEFHPNSLTSQLKHGHELGHETRNEVYKAPKIGVARTVVGEKLADISIPEFATIGMDTIGRTN